MTSIVYASMYASAVDKSADILSHTEALRASGFVKVVNADLCTQRELVWDFLPPSGSNLPVHRLVMGSEHWALYFL